MSLNEGKKKENPGVVSKAIEYARSNVFCHAPSFSDLKTCGSFIYDALVRSSKYTSMVWKRGADYENKNK